MILYSIKECLLVYPKPSSLPFSWDFFYLILLFFTFSNKIDDKEKPSLLGEEAQTHKLKEFPIFLLNIYQKSLHQNHSLSMKFYLIWIFLFFWFNFFFSNFIRQNMYFNIFFILIFPHLKSSIEQIPLYLYERL